MPSYLLLATVGLCLVYLVNTYRAFAANVAAAKRSGIPYVKTPVFVFNRFWMLTHPVWLAIMRRVLPRSWIDPWVEYTKPDFAWHRLYDTFRDAGSDNVLIVSPGKLLYLTADPEAITQINARRNDFPKPIEMYSSVDIFGKNVVTTEGHVWRQHRKITSPPFTEKNNQMVWRESLSQAQSMMAGWIGSDEKRSRSIPNVASEAMRLSLHVISRAGFGVQLKWPHEENAAPIPPGHQLSYKQALETLLLNLLPVMLTPKWILRNSPFRMHKVANQAYTEWDMYMREMYREKLAEIKVGEKAEGMDLMRALVEGAGTAQTSSDVEPEINDNILGNAFVFILAGHETAANTIHFSTLLLAMHWQAQKSLQEDLDRILGDRPVSEWDYDTDMVQLFGSMCGAVMNEELRLIPPVVGIPKMATRDRPQTLQLNDHSVNVPAGAYINISTAAVHRNPSYWPHTSLSDLEEFRPERWLLDPTKTTSSSTQSDSETYGQEEGLDFDGPDKRPDTASSLFRPSKGSYVPFSEGYRSCLGRRFAQVEILAVLAVMFKTWTVELDVSAWMSDEELERASEEEKRKVWEKADARARHLLRNNMVSIITLQMRGEKVPMRFVKRGCERLKFG